MKGLFGLGLVVLILGFVSLFVPVPHRERKGVNLGDVSIGVTTQDDKKVSPVVSAAIILGGAGMLAAAGLRRA
jgi:hypothetical protein